MSKRLLMASMAFVVSAGVAAATEQPEPGCSNIPNGPTVCRDGSTVSVGGKTDEKGIREFFEYPMGKSPPQRSPGYRPWCRTPGPGSGKTGPAYFPLVSQLMSDWP